MIKKATAARKSSEKNIGMNLTAAQVARLQQQIEQIAKEKIDAADKQTTHDRAAKLKGAYRVFAEKLQANKRLREEFVEELLSSIVARNTVPSLSSKDDFPKSGDVLVEAMRQEQAVSANLNAALAARKAAIKARKDEILNRMFFGDLSGDICSLLAEFRAF